MLGAGLPENARKELFSFAYMAAIAAAAGCELVTMKMDYDSIDGLVVSSAGKRPVLCVQLKATSQRCVENGRVSFPLSIKNYDDLRTEQRGLSAILVILHLPEDRERWLTHEPDQLLMRNNAYYLNLRGKEAVDNKESVTVHIPVDQRLTSASLQNLLDHVAEHGRLP
ncbi:MAG TPA: DUF4365 domain-containing protein [Candidatus Cybelea sp.]|nr:DUF4365 domain-containing protein [Candidatus Cybelea sp.]